MIYAHFESPEQKEARAYNVYQYDWGQKLQVTGLEALELPNHTEVHFALDGEETATTRVGTVSHGILVADVPFKCLQFAKKVYAYIYIVNPDADGGKTIKQVTFTPQHRAKPDDDVTPDEERVVDTMIRELNAATEQAQVDVKGAKEAAQTATAAKNTAVTAAETATAAKTAAGNSAAAAATSEQHVADNTAAVQAMYNNLTINIDGGDALNVDTHNIDGGTAETRP